MRDDPRGAHATTLTETVEHGSVVGASGQAGGSNVGTEPIGVGLAEAGHAWRQVHVGGVRRGEVRAATGRQGTAIDGVIDGAAHTATREQGPLGVQVDRVNLGLTMHEVALLALTRCDAARTVEALEACVLSGGNAVSG